MKLAHKLKRANEAPATHEREQIVSQQQESTKQQERGFEYGA